MRNLWVGLLGGAALMLAGAGSANAQSLVIDDFTVAQGPLFDEAGGGPTTGFVNGPVTSILGGQRDVIVESTGADIPFVPDVIFGAGLGQATANLASGAQGSIELQYDGDDGGSSALNTGGLGGIDLTASGNSFVFAVTRSDLLGLTVDIIVEDMLGNQSLFSATAIITIGPNPGDVPGPVDVVAPFAAFSPGANFANVGALSFKVTGAESFDVTVTSITAVPEPGTLGLFGTGLLALGWYARRQHRRRAAA